MDNKVLVELLKHRVSKLEAILAELKRTHPKNPLIKEIEAVLNTEHLYLSDLGDHRFLLH